MLGTLEKTPIVKNASYYRLLAEIQQFLFEEAELIDERRFTEWLECFHEDLRYFMPVRRNVKFGQQDERENTRLGQGISWFDEDKWTLGKRVEQILTGVHYAEEPLSRVSHLITNVMIRSILPDPEDPREVKTSCRFLVYQNRVEYENYTFVGRRYDTIAKTDGGWKVKYREIILDQNVLLAKSLTTFF